MPDDYVHPWLGRNHSDETKKKIGDANRGRKKTKEFMEKVSKKVLCVETGVVYPSIKEAAEDNGVTLSAVSRALRGKADTSGGYHWEYCLTEE